MNMEFVAYLLKANGMKVTPTFNGLEGLNELGKEINDIALIDSEKHKGRSSPAAHTLCSLNSTCHAK